MVPFRNYMTSILSESRKLKSESDMAMEDANRYVAELVDLHEKRMRRLDPTLENTSPDSNLLYDIHALVELQKHYLGTKYAHIPQFAEFAKDSSKQKSIRTIQKNFPHLIPSMMAGKAIDAIEEYG